LTDKKTRRRYTKEEKLLVLKEYSISKKSKAAFEKINLDFDNISNDKKYFSKLINKWKKELYKNAAESKLFSALPLDDSCRINKEIRQDYIMKEYLECKTGQNSDKN